MEERREKDREVPAFGAGLLLCAPKLGDVTT
jgi:hypothetical protein